MARWLVVAVLASAFVVATGLLARELLPLRSILGLAEEGPCQPSLASVRLPDNAASEDGFWQLAESYPKARDEVRAAGVAGRIYVGTGLTLSDGDFLSLDEIYEFDPRRGTYRTLPSVPARVDHAAFVEHRGSLYVIGGYVDGVPTSSVWKFSPKTGEWDALAPMRIRRGAPAAATIGGKIYVVGGSAQGFAGPRPIGDLEIYDIRSGTWTRGPSMTTPRHHHAAASANGRLVVVGGRSDDDLSFDGVEQFDPDKGEWSTLAPLPLGVGGLAVAAVGGQIVVAGGGDDEERWVTPATWALDLERNSWRRLADLNVARHGLAAAAVGPTVYIFGGAPCPGYGRTDVVESLDMTEGEGTS